MNSWRTALRIARREGWRARGRSLLIIAMLAIPVLWLSFAATALGMFRLEPDQAATREMGAATAQLYPIGNRDAGTPKDLPKGSRIVPIDTQAVDLRSGHGGALLTGLGLPVDDPMTAGMVTMNSGRAPAGPGEAVLNDAAAAELGVGVGDEVTVGDGGRKYTVVGLAEVTSTVQSRMVVAPGALPATRQSTPERSFLLQTRTPLTQDQVGDLEAAGFSVNPRDQISGAGMQGYLAIGGGVAVLLLLEVVLLVVPAFAVGARRRRRELALIAANGGTPAHQRRIVLADGVMFGAIAAVAGTVPGIASAYLAVPLLERHIFQYPVTNHGLPVAALLTVGATAMFAGVLAALGPAVTAARHGILDGLGAQRGAVRSSRRGLLLGLATVLLGVLLTGYGARTGNRNLVFAGIGAAEVGLLLCTPAVIGLVARAGAALPLSLRLALRDAARNRAAAAPAVGAVMAAVAGTVAVAVYMINDDAARAAAYTPALPTGYAAVQYTDVRPDPAAVTAALRSTLPVEATAEYRRVSCPAGAPAADRPGPGCSITVAYRDEDYCPLGSSARQPTAADVAAARTDPRCRGDLDGNTSGTLQVAVDDGRALTVVHGERTPGVADAVAVLRAGGVVVSPKHLVHNGRVTLEAYDGSDRPKERTLTVRAYALDTGTAGFATILPPSVVTRLGLTTRPGGIVAATSRTPTEVEARALADRLRPDGPTAVYDITVEQGPPAGGHQPVLLLLLAVAALTTLTAAAVATGLAAADSRPTLVLLATIGATPRVRRLLSLSQSAVIAGLGTALGLLSGLGLSLAAMLAQNTTVAAGWPPPPIYPLAVPWTELGLLVLVPLVAMAGAGLLTRSRLPVERSPSLR
ncbi:ABC transporter permease [Actinoplanes sp. NPDC049548]|uniref:ABC transporter permease n=1 Tax=Actinoplanes sp. NPDC049548 TaxID=3155152 RepID=UPI003440FAA8